jgi:hypothetical protein
MYFNVADDVDDDGDVDDDDDDLYLTWYIFKGSGL